MQPTKTVEVMVGLFVAMGLVALFFLAMKVSNLSDLGAGDKGYRVTARFENSGGLKVRAPVTVSGVKIGRVRAIYYDEEIYQAVVELQINPEFTHLPVDTTASVYTAGLLGEQYISLSPGGDEDYLKEGDEIELTQSAVILEEVLSKFLYSQAEGSAEGG